MNEPKCPYCNKSMTLSGGSYWCMNKECAEQFYPDGASLTEYQNAWDGLNPPRDPEGDDE